MSVCVRDDDAKISRVCCCDDDEGRSMESPPRTSQHKPRPPLPTKICPRPCPAPGQGQGRGKLIKQTLLCYTCMSGNFRCLRQSRIQPKARGKQGGKDTNDGGVCVVLEDSFDHRGRTQQLGFLALYLAIVLTPLDCTHAHNLCFLHNHNASTGWKPASNHHPKLLLIVSSIVSSNSNLTGALLPSYTLLHTQPWSGKEDGKACVGRPCC